MGIQISVDTGGTHTDLVFLDPEEQVLFTHKVPTTSGELSDGVIHGIIEGLDRIGSKLSEVDRLIYGTTLVTNIIIERDAVPVGLITTENFRDVLAMGRAFRSANLYDLSWRPSAPLVPRHLRLGVTERIGSDGKIIQSLDENMARECLAGLIEQGVNTIAVCLLNSYANPIHEQRIAEIARVEFPEIHLSVSSEIMREIREYDRTSTTVANAFVMKPIDEHLERLELALGETGLKVTPLVMRANGGVMSFAAAKKRPVTLTHSGPMGGIIGSAKIARDFNIDSIITLDMGGTSSDVALITGGQPSFTTKNDVAGLPVKLPMLELVTVGAGGGSIAWIDDAGGLKVGPKSAGANPGPACYGLGGTQPTVTDANLILGRLNPDWFLAGKGDLNLDLAKAAVGEIANQLGLGLIETALGILRISESHMVNAIKLASIKRGLDPRGMTLVGFGGAGPLHTLGLANQMDIRSAIVPCAPGNMSALGMLEADLAHNLVLSVLADLSDASIEELQGSLKELLRQGSEWLTEEGLGPENHLLIPSVELRYKGQSHTLSVPLSDGVRAAELREVFSAEHERVYGYNMPDDPVQLINLRVSAQGLLKSSSWARKALKELSGPQGYREVWFNTSGPENAPVWRFEGLSPTDIIRGPAIIEFTGSTFLLHAGWSAKCDSHGHLHAQKGEQEQ